MAEELTGEASLERVMEQLAGPNRRKRQEAARLVENLSKTCAAELVAHMQDLVDALERPEAQTRWEVLSALTSIAAVDAGAAAAALDGAEASLFDEDSAAVRLAAFKFLAALGGSSPERSGQVWPLLDEAVQCYHGDPEYRDMLGCLDAFAQADLADEVCEALGARLAFDAQNGRGYVRQFSAQIVERLSAR